jgi:hypothetical protein
MTHIKKVISIQIRMSNQDTSKEGVIRVHVKDE